MLSDLAALSASSATWTRRVHPSSWTRANWCSFASWPLSGGGRCDGRAAGRRQPIRSGTVAAHFRPLMERSGLDAAVPRAATAQPPAAGLARIDGMAPAPWTGRYGRGQDVSRMRHGIVPIMLATVYRMKGGEASGGCFAAGRFIELSDEHSLSSLQDQSRTREKCQPGRADGGLLAAGSFREETDEPILMSQQDQYRTRENASPDRLLPGASIGWPVSSFQRMCALPCFSNVPIQDGPPAVRGPTFRYAAGYRNYSRRFGRRG
jgi:hypothetical protein